MQAIPQRAQRLTYGHGLLFSMFIVRFIHPGIHPGRGPIIQCGGIPGGPYRIMCMHPCYRSNYRGRDRYEGRSGGHDRYEGYGRRSWSDHNNYNNHNNYDNGRHNDNNNGRHYEATHNTDHNQSGSDGRGRGNNQQNESSNGRYGTTFERSNERSSSDLREFTATQHSSGFQQRVSEQRSFNQPVHREQHNVAVNSGSNNQPRISESRSFEGFSERSLMPSHGESRSPIIHSTNSNHQRGRH